VSTAAASSAPDAERRPFLVEIRFSPQDVPPERRDAVLTDERHRGRQLMHEGKLERIWRVPGTSSSVSVWSARSPAELDEWLASLPIRPWSEIRVTELAEHPLEAELRAGDPPP
jgi:muconolactone D-isomerase